MIGAETIITKYVADISGYAPAMERIKKLQGEVEESTNQSSAASTNAGSTMGASSASMIKGLASVTVALAVAKAGWAEFREVSKLANASAGYDLAAISAAAGGTMTQMQIMQLAATSSSAAYKLTQKEVETAAAAIRGFTKDGSDQAQVINKVSDAITKGYGGGLDDLGVNIDKASSKSADFKNVMTALGAEAKKTSTGIESQSESMDALGVSFADSFSRMKSGIGEIVYAFKPLIEAIAKVTELSAGLVSAVGKGYSQISRLGGVAKDAFKGSLLGDKAAKDRIEKEFGGGMMDAREEFINAGNKGADFDAQMIINDRQAKERAEKSQAENAAIVKGMNGLFSKATEGIKALGDTVDGKITEMHIAQYEKRKAAAAKYADDARRAAEKERDRLQADMDWIEDYKLKYADATGALYAIGEGGQLEALMLRAERDSERGDSKERADSQGLGDAASSSAFDSMAIINKQYAGSEAAAADYNAFGAKDGESRLKKMFGPVEDFDAYAAGLDVLSAAMVASQEAFGEWIDGSLSFGEAFEAVMASQLKSISKEMFGQSLRHAAYALGELAFGNIPQASAHAAAALEFGAGAAALGYAASSLTSGSELAEQKKIEEKEAKDRDKKNKDNGNGNGNGGSEMVFIVGDDFAQDSPRMRERKATRVVAAARKQIGAQRN